MKFREIKLPSGAILKVAPATFAESKALFQALLEEAKELKVGSNGEVGQALKDAICIGFSSKKIEAALSACLARCTYNTGTGDLKIDQDTFEPVTNREDYTTVCKEVIEENVRPFAKSLYAEFSKLMAMIDAVRA